MLPTITRHDPLRPVPEEKAYTLLILNAYLEKSRKWEGPLCHWWMREWRENDLLSETDLSVWLRDKFLYEEEKTVRGPGPAVHRRRWNEAREQAKQWYEEGIRMYTWEKESLNSDILGACPQVLFGKGSQKGREAWMAVFNSRKSKRILPQEPWLSFLRYSLTQLNSAGMGLASSWGTTTYDLVTAYAQSVGIPLFLVLPFPVEEWDQGGDPILTCQTKAIRCSRAIRMVCRDRLLAFLSDVHLVLEIRSGGNLENILQRQQTISPRPQRIFMSNRVTPQNRGGFGLMKSFSRWSQPASQEESGASQVSRGTLKMASVKILKAEEISWTEYLYHYTRSCAGPWPGQSYEAYLMSLLEGDPLSGHAVLDTLIRILSEGRIRAGEKLIRGGRAVVSWTSGPPKELSALRRWNPALIRWTFEPYGIAVKRGLLLGQGCKPVIYGTNGVYERLREADRFRFQRHDTPGCMWKHEREWRLSKDLELDGIGPEDGFLFVKDDENIERLGRCRFPVVSLSSLLPHLKNCVKTNSTHSRQLL